MSKAIRVAERLEKIQVSRLCFQLTCGKAGKIVKGFFFCDLSTKMRSSLARRIAYVGFCGVDIFPHRRIQTFLSAVNVCCSCAHLSI